MKSSIILFTFCVVIAKIDCAAIPIWEFLSHDEKMSYVYANFVSQVESYCKTSEMKSCEKELVVHGLKKMHTMTDDQLDQMDPFERDAPQKIWESMMDGHELSKLKHKKTTSQKPLNHKKVQEPIMEAEYIPDAPILEESGSETTQQSSAEKKWDIYVQPNYLNQAASTNHESVVDPKTELRENRIIEGPMTVRVRPDGTFVDKKIPVDEDLFYANMAKVHVPSISNINRLESVTPLMTALFKSHPYAVVARP